MCRIYTSKRPIKRLIKIDNRSQYNSSHNKYITMTTKQKPCNYCNKPMDQIYNCVLCSVGLCEPCSKAFLTTDTWDSNKDLNIKSKSITAACDVCQRYYCRLCKKGHQKDPFCSNIITTNLPH
jgi:hypothetical protein